MEHTPVLLDETIRLLQLSPGLQVVDGTVGLAGHAKRIAEGIQPGGKLIALDHNARSLAAATEALAALPDITLLQRNFRQIGQVIDDYFGGHVDRVLLDLGLASWQIEKSGLGLSFQYAEPLDMRQGSTERGQTAAHLIQTTPEAELADILWRYGEEPQSRRLAKAMKAELPTTTDQLVEVVRSVKGRGFRHHHPATQTFQALRMAVNDEIAALTEALTAVKTCLTPHGRLAVISFHSGEDRLVKQTFRDWSRRCICPPEQPVCTCPGKAEFRLITKSAVQASRQEQLANPRSRSARLRVVEKLAL